MNLKTLFFLMSTTSALVAQPASPTGTGPTPPPAFAMPSGPIAPSDASAPTPASDNSALPSANFAPSRYESLWTKSPFAVETPETAMGEDSPDYMLVGIANVEGISYASLIERQNQEHFLISSDKPTRGLTLSNITRNHDGTGTYATVSKGGQTITLKLQQAPAAAGPGTPQPGMPISGMTGTAAPGTPGSIIPNIQMPGANTTPPGSMRPFPRIRRPQIHLPNQNYQQPAPPPPPPQPAPAH